MAVRESYIERYMAGVHEQVWAELQALGELVREEPLFSDARSAARETMRRVRRNFEVLVPRLQAIGYTFGYEWKQAQDRQDAANLEAYRIEHTQELLAQGMSPDDPFLKEFNRPAPRTRVRIVRGVDIGRRSPSRTTSTPARAAGWSSTAISMPPEIF
jgi:hypothetical protein